jgi:hypothetical protein
MLLLAGRGLLLVSDSPGGGGGMLLLAGRGYLLVSDSPEQVFFGCNCDSIWRHVAFLFQDYLIILGTKQSGIRIEKRNRKGNSGQKMGKERER